VELNRYLAILNRRKWIILVTAVVTLAVVALGSYMTTPTYTASTVLRVAPQHGINSNYAELGYVDRLMSTYVELVKSTPFVAEVMGKLHLQRDPFEVSSAVKASLVGTTQLIRISVDSADPAQAAAIANALAALLIEQERGDTRIVVVEPAGVPRAPTKPRLMMNLPLGAVIGLIGGVGLGLLFENLDPALHSSADLVSAVTVPLLGRIPRFKTRNRSRSGEIALGNGFSPSATEAFLGLSANVLSSNSGTCPKTLLVSSAEPRAGKSTVLVHLGAALAQAGRQVIVVDGDLRGPCLHHLLGLSRVPGLADVVLDPSVLDYTLRETQIRGLRALTAGRPQTNPVGLWHLPGVSEVIGKLAEAADVVLWDSPPVLVAADAALLARMLDGVLLVVAHDQSAIKQVNLALAQLGQVGATTVGIVYNRSSEDMLDYYDYPHNGAKPAKGPPNQPRQAKTKSMSPVSRQSTA